MVLQASTRVCTEATDFSNIFFSSAIEGDLDDPLDAIGADDDRHADIKAFDAIFAIELRGAGQNPALVAQIGFRHGDRRGRRRIKSRAGLQETDDFAAALAGALDDGVEPGLRGPAHLDEIGQRDAGDRRIAQRGHHVVAVAAEHEGAHILERRR